MILYHGSITEVENPKILPNEVGRDFGFAFYTTDIREQAERWAIRKAKIANRIRKGNLGIVNIYEWIDNGTLDVKRYSGPSMQWLDMVVQCRSDINYRHRHDIVIGNIANDNVGETVSYVLQGIMRKEDAVERLKFEKINNQLAFCTEAALKQLKYKECYVIEV